jgi:hypothetical protein
MAKQTKFKLNCEVSFNNQIKVSYVASGILQRGAAEHRKVLGKTKPHYHIPKPVLEWDESKAGDNVTLVITEVSAQIVYHARVLIDKAIDKKSDCFKKVIHHEDTHVQFYREGVPKYEKAIVDMVRRAVSAKFDKSKKLAVDKAKKFKSDAVDDVIDMLRAAAKEYKKRIHEQSMKIHTAAELAETSTVCAVYLKKTKPGS